MTMQIKASVLISAAVENGMIDAETVAHLQVKARRERIDLLDAVTHHGRFPVSALYRALADVRGLPFIAPRALQSDQKLLAKIPDALLYRRAFLPIAEQGDKVLVATDNPDDQISLDMLRRILGRPIVLALADPEAIKAAIRETGRLLKRPAGDFDALGESDSVAELDRIFKQAYLNRATDIHFEPHQNGLRVRLRVDGRLQDYPAEFSEQEGQSLISRVKVLAGLDISEQREPQDGGISYHLPKPSARELDIRVATVPTRFGERATLRIMGQGTEDLSLEGLGLSEKSLGQFREVIKRPYGMILLTGPTGSGKSTTLYGALNEINHPDCNIMTVEDPVEYPIDGLSQIQVSGKVSFASALRSLLRHDPDVLMVGEIRDAETAGVALKAAMTGHLVFSTLHTNDAVSAVTRLADIGAERYLIAATLLGVIAQRLVRRLCMQCRRPREATNEEKTLLSKPDGPIILFDPVGCANCMGTGYSGRLGLFETLWLDRQVSDRIAHGASEAEIAEAATGLSTLWSDGCEKVITGLTALEELKRAAVPPKQTE